MASGLVKQALARGPYLRNASPEVSGFNLNIRTLLVLGAKVKVEYAGGVAGEATIVAPGFDR